MKTILLLLTVLLANISYGQYKVPATVVLKNNSEVKLSVLNMRYLKYGNSSIDDTNFLILKDNSGNYMQIPFKNISQIIPLNDGKRFKVIMKSGNVKEGYDGRGYKWVCGYDVDEIFVMHKLSGVSKIIVK